MSLSFRHIIVGRSHTNSRVMFSDSDVIRSRRLQDIMGTLTRKDIEKTTATGDVPETSDADHPWDVGTGNSWITSGQRQFRTSFGDYDVVPIAVRSRFSLTRCGFRHWR